LQPSSVIEGVSGMLFATAVSLSRLDGDTPQKELDLFELTSGLVAKTRLRGCDYEATIRGSLDRL
jgi:hypothetical protein